MGQTVGEFLQSRIHKSFTVASDDLYALGYLSTEERIAFSALIGDVLGTFTESMADGDLAEAASREVSDEHLAMLIQKRGGSEMVEKALLPLAPKDRAWDADAAVDRLREWAGGPDKEDIDWSQYAIGFAWVEGEGEDFGEYHLPFADVVSSEDDQDGEPHAVWNGVVAVVAALNGARGADIPEEPRQDAYNLMERYYEAFEEEIPELKEAAQHPFKITLPILKYYMSKDDDGQEHHFVEGAASDVSEDLHGDRMGETTIVKFVEYVALDDPPVGLDVEHSEDWTDQIGKAVEAAVLYEVPADLPGEPPVFWVKFEVDTDMSHGRDLVAALKSGKKLGLSIAGNIIEFHIEEDGTRILDHVRLYKIAVTKQPANRNTWLMHVTKSLPVAKQENMDDEPWFDLEWWLEDREVMALLDSLASVIWEIAYSGERDDKRELLEQALSVFRERMVAVLEAWKASEEALFQIAKALGLEPVEDETFEEMLVEKLKEKLEEARENGRPYHLVYVPGDLDNLVKVVEDLAAEQDDKPIQEDGETPECDCQPAGEPAPELEQEPEPVQMTGEEPAPEPEEQSETEPVAQQPAEPEEEEVASSAPASNAELIKTAIESVRDDLKQTVLQAVKTTMQEGQEVLRAEMAEMREGLDNLTTVVEAQGQDVEMLKAQPMGRRGINVNNPLGTAQPGVGSQAADLDRAIEEARKSGNMRRARQLWWKKTTGR